MYSGLYNHETIQFNAILRNAEKIFRSAHCRKKGNPKTLNRVGKNQF